MKFANYREATFFNKTGKVHPDLRDRRCYW